MILGTVVKEFKGDKELNAIIVSDSSNAYDITVDGVFTAIGLIPQNDNFSDVINLDERGYADSDESCLTNAEGIFVAGDCRKKNIRQVATAASDGAIAALAACSFIG